MRNTAVCIAVILLTVVGVAPFAASARPLDSTTCADLDKEKTALESAGVPSDMQLKPEEAKALAADKLQRIQRYVQISADVLFRCPIAVVIAPDEKPVPAATPAKVATTDPVSDATAKKPAPVPASKLRAQKSKKGKR